MRRDLAVALVSASLLFGCTDSEDVEPGSSAASIELGVNDRRISTTGPDGDIAYDASLSAVAYNATDDEYLVVWQSDAPLDGEFEVFGQRLAADGSELGADFRISTCGPEGDIAFDGGTPAVAWNSDDNEYFAVWVCDQIANAEEVYGQRITGAGALVGGNVRLSDMGPEGVVGFATYMPQLAYDTTAGEYLVVWQGDDAVDGKQEIWGQRVSAAGAEVGTNDFSIASVGLAADVAADALDPDVVWNPTAGEMLVVFAGDTSVVGEDEIFAQRVASGGALVGGVVRVSHMGPDGDVAYDAVRPRVSYSATANEYLVVWEGDDDTGVLVDGHDEIYGQRLDATAAPVAARIRVSFTAVDTDAGRDANRPDVAWDAADNEWFVVWDAEQVGANELEVHARRLSETGALLDTELRLSDMGPEGDTSYRGVTPSVAYNSTRDQVLVTWNGDDDIAPLVEGEDEVFVQLWGDTVEPGPDAGTPDAMPMPDAGAPDGAPADATPIPDAAPIADAAFTADAGAVDAAPAADAGEADAAGAGEEMNPPDAAVVPGDDDDGGGGCDCRTAAGGGGGNAAWVAWALLFAVRRRRR